mmetsp:Transcript_19746/g.42879  ORF Transcript_19746/g.42879 Transcript_19746/m.42879 type:complete len:324 (+) Transcript_19746:1794-2765(+)
MRYENPIVAIQQVPATDVTNAYTKTHVSFQSTGCTNISGVNNLPSAGFYVTIKSRGRGKNKRSWGIEQNEGRATYLSQYYAVDNVDHMISIAMVRYITWKYWHSPYLHCLSMAIIAAYDMYIECCEGDLDGDWRIPETSRMSFRVFRLTLSEQMLKYNPKYNNLPGDEHFRAWTRRPKRKRDISVASTASYIPGDGVSVQNFKKAKEESRHKTPRLCGDLRHIKKHLASIKKQSNRAKCEVCGELTSFKCALCDKYVCLFENRKWIGGGCAMSYHDDAFFGLSKSDNILFGKHTGTWTPPTQHKIVCNARRVETIKETILQEE